MVCSPPPSSLSLKDTLLEVRHTKKTDSISQQLIKYWVIFHAFLSSADFFFQNLFFDKILSGIPSECQTVWTQIRPNDSSDLIWVQSVCQSNQQTTLVDKELRHSSHIMSPIKGNISSQKINTNSKKQSRVMGKLVFLVSDQFLHKLGCTSTIQRKLEAGNFRHRKQKKCTIYGEKKALISCRVTVQLICEFVFT